MLRSRYFVVPDQPTAMRTTGLQINDRARDSAEFQATSVLCFRKQRRARQTLDSSILRSLIRRFMPLKCPNYCTTKGVLCTCPSQITPRICLSM
jgi:hypothetical protein